jgi:hypothetical protein
MSSPKTESANKRARLNEAATTQHHMGDYDFKPAGGLKLKGVKDKKIKKKKGKSENFREKREITPDPKNEGVEEKPKETVVVHKTEAERRFEEIQRQRV